MQLQQQVNQLSTLHISSMQLHMLNSFCQVALWWVLIEKSKWGNKFDRQSKTFLNNTIVILIQCKQLTAKTSIWLKSGAQIASSSYSDIFSPPTTWNIHLHNRYGACLQVQNAFYLLSTSLSLSIPTFATVFTYTSGISLGFWETAHLPLPCANTLP